jgi:hypothetical protein
MESTVPEAELANIVEKFEACDFSLEEFTHSKHLTVACWYLATLPYDKALVRMRLGLKRFIQHHGKQGYHETITRFWMILLDQALRTTPEEWELATRVEHVVAEHADKNMLFRYYSRERVLCDEAKTQWREPDLHAIESGISIP